MVHKWVLKNVRIYITRVKWAKLETTKHFLQSFMFSEDPFVHETPIKTMSKRF